MLTKRSAENIIRIIFCTFMYVKLVVKQDIQFFYFAKLYDLIALIS